MRVCAVRAQAGNKKVGAAACVGGSAVVGKARAWKRARCATGVKAACRGARLLLVYRGNHTLGFDPVRFVHAGRTRNSKAAGMEGSMRMAGAG